MIADIGGTIPLNKLRVIKNAHSNFKPHRFEVGGKLLGISNAHSNFKPDKCEV